MNVDLDKYLEELKQRHPQTNAKSFTQETAEKYLKYIVWENGKFYKDIRAFWIAIYSYKHFHTHAELVDVLEWIKEKNSLAPQQVLKVLYGANKKYV